VTDGDYAPPPEAAGGWRWQPGADSGGLLPAVERRRQDALWNGYPWGLVVIHQGWLVAERYSFNVGPSTRFDVWSATKSVTALAWGILLEHEGRDAGVGLDTPVYDLLAGIAPAGGADSRRRAITIGQVLSMTSGIPGERHGVFGVAVGTGAGAFEFAFGQSANRAGAMTEPLAFDPGTDWDYSDPGYCHLSPALSALAGSSLADYVQHLLFDPVGIDRPGWDDQGGRGHLGPFTNAHSGLHLSARELARVGYLALRAGRWGRRQVVPTRWLELVRRPSQAFNPAYGLGWWTNRADAYVPGLPSDLFAMAGFAGNRCWVLPSHDLVVARVGAGPAGWDDRELLPAVLRGLTLPG